MKKSILKTIPYVLVYFLGVYIIEILTAYLMALSQFKAQIGIHVNEVLTNAIQHPLSNIQMYIQQHNPIMILGALGLLGYLFYFAMKRHSKNQDWQTADEQTHGSARWGSEKEIIDDGHYFKFKEKETQNKFKSSLDDNVLKEIRKLRGEKE